MSAPGLQKDVDLLQTICEELTAGLSSSNFVQLNDLVESERLQESFGLEGKGLRREIGKALSNVEWAERWSRGTYMIQGT